MSASPARTTQKMTLRRFVRVTFDNFRELIQTIAAPTTSLPVPNLRTSPKLNGTADDDSQPLPVEPTSMETDTIDGGTHDADSAGELPAGSEELTRQEPGEEPGPEPSPELAHEPEPDLAPAGEVSAAASDAAEAEQEDVPVEEITVEEITVADITVADITAENAAAEDITPEETASAGADTEESDAESGAESVAESVAESGAESVAVAALPLVAALESLLFVSDEAVEPAQLARAIGLTPAEVEGGLQALDAAYREGNRGLRLQTRNGRYQLVTAPEAANLIETFLNLDATSKLSAPALETLAVVAYRQPVTRAQIEAVRGVDCSGVLRSLLQRGLLEEVGRLDAPGRPVLYGVTDLFMHHFGLTALHELPPLENAELARIDEAIEQQA